MKTYRITFVKDSPYSMAPVAIEADSMLQDGQLIVFVKGMDTVFYVNLDSVVSVGVIRESEEKS